MVNFDAFYYVGARHYTNDVSVKSEALSAKAITFFSRRSLIASGEGIVRSTLTRFSKDVASILMIGLLCYIIIIYYYYYY